MIIEIEIETILKYLAKAYGVYYAYDGEHKLQNVDNKYYVTKMRDKNEDTFQHDLVSDRDLMIISAINTLALFKPLNWTDNIQ